MDTLQIRLPERFLLPSHAGACTLGDELAQPLLGNPQEQSMAIRKKTLAMAVNPLQTDCPKCGHTNETGDARVLRIDLRPVLTKEVFAFPDALAEVSCVKCGACGYWICLDYRIELDDNPEIDLNPE
jgi:hypothetical protein